MSDTCEARLKECEKEHEQWRRNHDAWVERFQDWKSCEQRVSAFTYELESVVPEYRMRLDKFNEIVLAHERELESYGKNFRETRAGFVDDECPEALANLKSGTWSKCRKCDPMCVDGLLEIHRQGAALHVKMMLEYNKLQDEFESAMQQMKVLTNELLACLNKY